MNILLNSRILRMLCGGMHKKLRMFYYLAICSTSTYHKLLLYFLHVLYNFLIQPFHFEMRESHKTTPSRELIKFYHIFWTSGVLVLILAGHHRGPALEWMLQAPLVQRDLWGLAEFK